MWWLTGPVLGSSQPSDLGRRVLCRVERGRRQGEDEPAVTVDDELPAEDVAADSTHCSRFRRVQQDMGADERHAVILLAKLSLTPA